MNIKYTYDAEGNFIAGNIVTGQTAKMYSEYLTLYRGTKLELARHILENTRYFIINNEIVEFNKSNWSLLNRIVVHPPLREGIEV
jgi:hypothetical protein